MVLVFLFLSSISFTIEKKNHVFRFLQVNATTNASVTISFSLVVKIQYYLISAKKVRNTFYRLHEDFWNRISLDRIGCMTMTMVQ